MGVHFTVYAHDLLYGRADPGAGTTIALPMSASLVGRSAWQQMSHHHGREAFGLPVRNLKCTGFTARGRRIESLVTHIAAD